MNSILKEILSEMNILAESVEINDINDAIKSMRLANIVYDDGEDGDGKGERIICPVAYGLSTKGNPVIRAFQRSGSSKRGVGKWKLFKLSSIKNWETEDNQSYNANELVGFNKEGDRQMQMIYSIAPIGNAKEVSIMKKQGMPDKLSNGPVTKSDVNNAGKEEKLNNSQINKPQQKVDNSNYTADNAIDDILSTAKNVEKKSVDKSEEKPYINNDNLNAPETEPVTKNEIPGGDNKVSDDEFNSEEPKKAISDDPISKKDLEKDTDDDEEEFRNKYNDMMKRIDDLDKNKEEKED